MDGSEVRYPVRPRFSFNGTPGVVVDQWSPGSIEFRREYKNMSPSRGRVAGMLRAGLKTPQREDDVEVEVCDELFLPVTPPSMLTTPPSILKFSPISSVLRSDVGVQHSEAKEQPSPAASKMTEPTKPSFVQPPPTTASFSSVTAAPSPLSSDTESCGDMHDEHVAIRKPEKDSLLGLRVDDHLRLTLVHPNTPAAQLSDKIGYSVILANNRPATSIASLSDIWNALPRDDTLHLLIRPPSQSDI
eukprot:TRINITY_DN12075_c0_g1_i1.p1 TRINITY_DN12075_c0_g1~~TRINITY_DN12075_c0_g1_i1.p1  ORF type:complete len:245 (+),score=42.14 TRINITY_DN12075_c0_g1_i1:37-771(+)